MRNKQLRMRLAAALVLSALVSTSCLQFKTNTAIRMESSPETATIYEKSGPGSEEYSARSVELIRYRLIIDQVRTLDLGRTILSTLEIVGSVCLSAAMAMMLTNMKSVSRIY
jgi:hypothetical protein